MSKGPVYCKRSLSIWSTWSCEFVSHKTIGSCISIPCFGNVQRSIQFQILCHRYPHRGGFKLWSIVVHVFDANVDLRNQENWSCNFKLWNIENKWVGEYKKDNIYNSPTKNTKTWEKTVKWGIKKLQDFTKTLRVRWYQNCLSRG